MACVLKNLEHDHRVSGDQAASRAAPAIGRMVDMVLGRQNAHCITMRQDRHKNT